MTVLGHSSAGATICVEGFRFENQAGRDRVMLQAMSALLATLL
jgi:hypothetical protein